MFLMDLVRLSKFLSKILHFKAMNISQFFFCQIFAPPINSIDSKCRTEKLKGSRTCLIGYSDFISRE